MTSKNILSFYQSEPPSMYFEIGKRLGEIVVPCSTKIRLPLCGAMMTPRAPTNLRVPLNLIVAPKRNSSNKT